MQICGTYSVEKIIFNIGFLKDQLCFWWKHVKSSHKLGIPGTTLFQFYILCLVFNLKGSVQVPNFFVLYFVQKSFYHVNSSGNLQSQKFFFF